jgi:ParB family chromosome partitioning protein
MTAQSAAAPTANSAPNTSVGTQLVLIREIRPDPANRKDHDQAKLKDLAAQIKAEGLLQPIVIRRLPVAAGAVRYQIIAGERRFEAHKLLKAEKIEAKIVEGGTELQAVTKQTIENVGRENLDPMSQARQMQRLADLKMPQSEIGKLFGGLSQPVVSNTIRLLELPKAVQGLLREGKLNGAHGAEIVRWVKFPKAATKIAELAIKHETTAKELRKLPFYDDLVAADVAVELDDYYNFKDLPKAYQESDGLAECENEYGDEMFICFDLDLVKRVEEEETRRAQEEAKAAAAKPKTASGSSSGGGSNSGGSKLSPAELAKRKKVIADNKQARLESTIALEAAYLQLRGLKTLDKSLITALVRQVLTDSHYSYVMKDAAAKIGLTVPTGLRTSSYLEPISLSKLRTMSDVDQLRLAAVSVAHFHGQRAIDYAHNVCDQVNVVIGEAKTKVCQKQAADKLATEAAAKAAKKKGGK